jgi:hypothetical protein
MHSSRKTIPFYPLLFAIFPILSLFETNVREVEPTAFVRPLLVSLAMTILLFIVARFILGSWQRAGLAVSLLLVVFFTYGHGYNLIKNTTVLNINIGRHRYLLALYFALTGLGLLWIIRKARSAPALTSFLNLLSILLLIYPTFNSARILLETNRTNASAEQMHQTSELTPVMDASELPDVYVIILDTYTRADALQRDFGFDDSDFIDELESLGFYVADCAHTNELHTRNSITTLLNLEYVPTLEQQLETSGETSDGIWGLFKHSYVRDQLTTLGYKTVAFDTGFEWSRLKDADIYLGMNEKALSVQINPFESMLIDTTIIRSLYDLNILKTSEETLKASDQPFNLRIHQVLYLLDQLPEVASDPEPKFVFAHILSPHVPYVFLPDGSLTTDPGFYSGEGIGAINEEYTRLGYVNQIQFINSRILEIIKTILQDSKNPPIILLMGDHGLQDQNRGLILNAYYLPDGGKEELYPSISPVNSFRVIFNEYFGTDFEILPDLTDSEETGNYSVIADPLAECAQP